MFDFLLLQKIKKIILDIVYPVRCVGCASPDRLLCEECLGKIEIKKKDVCPVCNHESKHGKPHEWCRDKSFLDGILVACDFGNEFLEKVIYAFKYNFVQSLGDDLSRLMIAKIRENNDYFEPKITDGYFDFILPVPLHRYRFLWRGFNQADVLVDKIIDFLGVKNASKVVVRRKFSTHQAGKSRISRKDSLEGAFSVNNRLTLEEKEVIRGKKILLVDDVLTTGFTMQEVAKILKKELGAGEVWGVVIARSD